MENVELKLEENKSRERISIKLLSINPVEIRNDMEMKLFDDLHYVEIVFEN